jgi:predicted dehydrogenase
MPIDVALLGCAHPHLPEVLGVLASEPSLRLAAVWDADPTAIPGAIAGAWTRTADGAISRADAVVVCAPTDQRPALVVQAARAGRPVLVEKPIALTANDARALVREVERTRTPVVSALFLRELPALRRLVGVLRERLLGRLSGVTATYAHPGALDGWFDGPLNWMREPARAGVGGFGDLALHLIDAITLLPADEPPRLAAVALDRVGGPGRGDVGGAALGTWAGVPLSLRAGWASRPGGLELVITGAAGTATVRGGTIELARGGGEPERWIGAPPDAAESVRAFAEMLRSRRFGRASLAPAVRAQAILEGALPVG